MAGGQSDGIFAGGAGNDVIFNGSGNDTVDGGAGDDTIWGSGGDDLLIGGSGSDTFTFGTLAGNDRIADFATGEDILDLRYAAGGFDTPGNVTGAARLDVDNGGSPSVTIDLVLDAEGTAQSVTLTGLTLADLADMTILI